MSGPLGEVAGKGAEGAIATVPSTLHPSQTATSSTEESSLTLEKRRTFLKKPLAERRQLLAAQAATIQDHYQQNPE